MRPQLEVLAGDSDRDIRAKRPHLITTLFRRETILRAVNALSLAVLDVGFLFSALVLALVGKSLLIGEGATWGESSDYARAVLPYAALVMVLQFTGGGLYGPRMLRPGASRIIGALFGVTVLMLLVGKLEGYDFSSYYIFYSTFIIGSLLIVAGRTIFNWGVDALDKVAGHTRRAAIVGSNHQIEAVANALVDDPHGRVRPIGFVSLEPRPENGMKNLGTIADLENHFDEIDEVILADPDFPQESLWELVERCHRANVNVRIAPSTMDLLVHRAEFVPGESVPLFELKPPVFEGIDFVIKRSFDIVCSSLALILLAPVLALIALAVKVTSPGPIIYKSMRPGIGGEPFNCLKFRTMRSGADSEQHLLEALNEADGVLFKIRHDPRLTPIGHFLRRLSIDELPQIWNVLRGDMSLVGPRPLPQRDFDRLDAWHRKRYLVLPGLTGLWQVSGRSELDFDELVRLDFLYIERWSVFLDIVIIFRTIPAVFARKGAW